MADAREDAVEALEDSLYERGLAGDNVAAIFWLKGAKPEKYREQVAVRHGGDPTNPAPIRIQTITAVAPPEAG